MKNSTKALLTVFIIFLLSIVVLRAKAQVSINSTNGYTVNIYINPTQIVPTTATCVNGYNYNVRLSYTITFTGSNFPAGGLYTLQGTLGCGSSSHFFDLPNGQGTGQVLSQSNVWTGQTNCNTATVTSMGCNTGTIEIDGPGITPRTVPFTVGGSTLPVKLINFQAVPEAKKVKVSWKTVSESNNDFFTIEKSADRTNWTAVKNIDGAGNSNGMINYSAYDEQPVEGTTYYRLKQTDFDGHHTYSDIRMVKYTVNITTIAVYPTPNAGNTIHISGITNHRDYNLTVVNMNGQSLYTTALTSGVIELKELKAGMYIIRLQNKNTGEETHLRYMKS